MRHGYIRNFLIDFYRPHRTHYFNKVPVQFNNSILPKYYYQAADDQALVVYFSLGYSFANVWKYNFSWLRLNR